MMLLLVAMILITHLFQVRGMETLVCVCMYVLRGFWKVVIIYVSVVHNL